MSNNLATVEKMYNCFGQGDIPGVLACMADDISLFNSADPKKAPVGGTFTGKAGAIEYFQRLGSSIETTGFVPSNFREMDGKVINDVRHEGVVKSTGKPFSVDIQFNWTFDESGKAKDWKGLGEFSSLENAYSSN